MTERRYHEISGRPLVASGAEGYLNAHLANGLAELWQPTPFNGRSILVEERLTLIAGGNSPERFDVALRCGNEFVILFEGKKGWKKAEIFADIDKLAAASSASSTPVIAGVVGFISHGDGSTAAEARESAIERIARYENELRRYAGSIGHFPAIESYGEVSEYSASTWQNGYLHKLALVLSLEFPFSPARETVV